MNFRKEQLSILEYKKGIMSISAVPGAGKTFILVYLIKSLLENNFDSNKKILLLTYMNSAVNNFQERISSNAPKSILSNLEVKTIHKLAQDVLRSNFGVLGLSEDYSIIDSQDKNTILSKLCRNWYNNNLENIKFVFKEKERTPENIKDFSSIFQNSVSYMISKFKMEGINSHKIFTETHNYKIDSLLPYVASIYVQYQEELNKKGALDYDDLLFYAYKLLKENLEIREKYQSKYLYIFEDEAQDSNSLQNKILALLTQKGGNLVKVGDPNQSIMGTFTNASPELFREFIKHSPIKKQISTAGRSSIDIIKLANNFHKYIKESHPCVEARDSLVKPYIKPVSLGEFPENPKPLNSLSKIIVNNEREEIENLVLFIKKFNIKYPEKTIGILVPRNSLITTISRRFSKEQLDFGTLNDIDMETLDALKKLGDIVYFLSQPYDTNHFILILKSYFLPEDIILDKNILDFIKKYKTENLFFDNIQFPETIINSHHFLYLKKCLEKLDFLLKFSINGIEKTLIYIGDLFEFSLQHRGLIENIAVSLKSIFKFNPKWTLKDLALELKKTENNRLGFFNPVIKNEKYREKNIVITNYHKSKGREWDFVYLFGLNSFYFPAFITKTSYGDKLYLKNNFLNIQAYINWELNVYLGLKDYVDPIINSKIERISESIRLIFVGITRAKEYLVISINKEKDEFYLPLFKKMFECVNRKD